MEVRRSCNDGRLFILAKDFVQVFESTPRIQVSRLTTVFAQKLKRNIRLRDYGCSGVEKLVQKLSIFERHEDEVSLSQPKVLRFFFCPVLQSWGGSILVEDVPACFKETTGLDVHFLYTFTGVTSLHEFVKHLLHLCHGTIQQESFVGSGLQSLSLCQFDRSVSANLEGVQASPESPPPTKKARMQSAAPLQHSTFGERDVPMDFPTQGHPPADPVGQKRPLLLTPHAPFRGTVSLPGMPQIAQCRPHPDRLPPHPVMLQFSPSPSHRDPLPVHPAVQIMQQFSQSPSHRPPHPAMQPSPSPPPPSMKSVTKTFPNSDEDELVANKPCHPRFRPDMEGPNLPVAPLKTKRNKKMDKQWVNSTLEAMIEDLSLSGKFLPTYKVWDLLQSLLRQAHQSGRAISFKEIPAWSEFSKAHGRIEELIKVFCRMSPVTSLYELEQAIVSTEGVDNYEALHLGPLLRHPLVQNFFKPPTDLESIPNITSFKMYKHLSEFVNKRSNRSERQSLEEFLEFMQKRERLESVYHLCVRITSFPLAVQTTYRFRSTQRLARQRREKDIEKEVAAILDHEVDVLRRRLSASSNDPLSVRRDLAMKDPAQILFGIFEACQSYFSGFQKARINDFLHFITQSQRFRRLFILAIYEGAYGMEKLLPQLVEERTSYQQLTAVSSNPEEQFHQPPGDVLQKLLELLRRTSFPTDLACLARIEKHVADHFSAPTFDSLGNSSFLHFLTAQEKAITALGGSLIGAHHSGSHTASMKRRLLELILQLKQEKKKNREAVTAAITLQFGVSSVEDLGCGNVDKLMAEEVSLQQQTPSTPTIAFLSPLLINDGTSESGLQHVAQSPVGVLGHQTRQDALKTLQKAPLLDDLTEWSHWELVYKPQLGSLSDFLVKEASTAGPQRGSVVHALELSPGRLLHINPDSSLQDFIAAVEASDSVTTAGHLVSMVVKRGSVREVSMQLLANRVETALEKMCAGSDTVDGLNTGHQPTDVAAKFVFDCLLRIPFKICSTVASVVFVEPLRKVVSTSAVTGLLALCKTAHERRFLQSLGMVVGVKAWADDFATMLREPTRTTHHADPARPSQPVETASEVTVEHPPADESSDGTVGVATNDTSEAMEEEVPAVSEPPHTAEELALEDTRCRSIVESIRREEFGIGLELDERQQEVAQRQRRREGRGLKRLSLELYSKDTHFVLELIQNADDNSYRPVLLSGKAKEVPSLKFVVAAASVTILNNEIGFSESNIRAVCDVGQSTKGVHRSGYIGQKGIGFKSVFRVTDTPEIHSNGFHIMFDARSDHIGYILPRWVEGSQRTQGDDQQWMTRIVLPLKKDHQTTKKFRDIQPSLLLFLHRLRSITVEDQVSGEARHMTRYDSKHSGITEIVHDDGTDRWLVVRRRLSKAKQYKPDVEVTELALAFPLPPDLKVLPLAKDLQHQQVFAFLPLRSYGFRFIVQGDFDLPSSREDVNSDSPWNQWLREEIPSLFIETMETNMKELPGVSPLQAAALFLQFVPLEGELHDFFRPVTSQILHLLKGKPCLPTEPVADDAQGSILSLVTPASDRPGEGLPLWKQPSQLLFVRNDFIRRHIPQALLASTLRLSYLHSSLLSAVNPSLQLQLGMHSMSVDHLVEVAQAVLRAVDDGDNSSTSEDDSSDLDDSSDSESRDFPRSSSHATTSKKVLSWIANWLACVHIVMEDGSDVEALDKLRQLPLIPLEDGTLASTADSALFFPPESSTVGENFTPLFRELMVVTSSLFSLDDDLVRSRVHKMLQLLGVKNLHPADIIHHHILPVFTSGQWKSKSKESLCTYLVYIKEKMAERGSGVSETEMIRLLKDCVVVVTNQGSKQPCKEVVHFSSAYRCEDDLQTKFPDVRWTVVSPSYLGRSVKIESISSWRTLLTKLGVRKGIAVERRVEHVSTDTHRWDELHDWRRSPDGSYTVRDYHSKEVDDIISSVSGKPYDCQHNQMKMLAELLDKNWEAEYKHYLAEVYDGANQSPLGPPIQSSFHRSLAQRAWLPPKGVAREKVLYRGSELYDSSRHLIRNLLHSHVMYIGADLKSQDLVQLLQIKCTIDTDDLLKLLLTWSDSLTFDTTIEHMTYVYLYLKQKSDEQQLQGLVPYSTPNINDQIKEGDLIFVPDEQRETSTERATAGQFYSVHQVCWNDPTGVLYKKQKYNKHLPASLPKVLQPHYSSQDPRRNEEIRQAFLHFGVQEFPTTASLIALLKYISSTSPSPEPYHVDDFTSIAFELVSFQSRRGLPPEFIYSNLRNVKVFPTQDHKWVSLGDGLFEGDDPQLVKRFSEAEGIHFLQWPSNLQSKHKGHVRNWENQQCQEAFIAMCKIPKLSEVAHPRITQTGVLKRSDDLQTKLYHCIPLIQRYLAKYYPDKYSAMKMGMKEKLQRLQVFSVLSLQYIHVVEHDGREIASSAIMLRQSEFEDGDPPAIYVVANKADRLSILLPALKLLFMSQDEEEFERFLTRELLPEEPTSSEEIEQIAKNSVYDLPPLPEEDPVWTIPLPRQQPVTAEEETEEELSDSEGEQSTDSSPTTAEEDPSKGLKSWPPRASVPLEGVDASQKTAARTAQSAAPIWPPPNSGGNSTQDAYAISKEEIRQVQQKHLHDHSELVNEGNSVVHPSRQLSHTSTEGAGVPERQFSQPDHLISHSTSERQTSNLGGTNHTAPERMALPPSQKEHHHPAIDIRHEHESAWKAFQNVQDFPVVDIRPLMHTVALQDADHLLLPPMAGVDEESLKKVGRWGEQFVYTFLKAKGRLPDGREFQSIHWANENEESANPYDIEVQIENEKVYIEVKSTSSAHKELVAISWQELKFAEEQGGRYHLYRVYSAGKASKELCWLEDLFNYLQNNPVRFFFEL